MGRACTCVATFARRAGQASCERIGHRRSAFRRGRTAQCGFELLRHLRKIVIGLRRDAGSLTGAGERGGGSLRTTGGRIRRC